ncbi:protein kinase domain-containing protein [Heyndrickxia oleronia]|uniref:protein kinase domain-containing protein n=1 Tax=Heyndrickxia oleronia TaxID=38875 RepID=UPI001B12F3A3|nr:serine/threonine-protein kinase [Heyndrickxia oleronia]GIN37227.1 serine/threonine protein kinase [Heyndrickxia oleronia]
MKNEERQKVIDLTIDKVSFQLQEVHDFSWLKEIGEVFCVFDQQDSGNIGFGLAKNNQKFFVKYAGAKPIDYFGNPEDAIDRLLKAIPVYEQLKHPYLTKMIEHFYTENGYAVIFEWFEGECLHSHWSFGGKEKYINPHSPFYRFKHLDINKRLNVLNMIYSFHVFVEAKGFVAVDFYDGSILYDFKDNRMKICDIDFYRKSPIINEIGNDYWGAVRSKAPEEFILGEPIDSKTNVFTMGAIAFGLVGGEMDHSISKWQAGEKLYEVAIRATEKNRDDRYCTLKEFYEAWQKALN